MKEKLVILLIIGIFLLAGMSTASSVDLISANDSKVIESKEGKDNPIKTNVIAEQIDGRTWNIKIYAFNQLDEDIKIRTSPISVITWIIGEVNGIYDDVYGRTGPEDRWFPSGFWLRFPFRYIHTKEIPYNSEILLDEFTFTGETNGESQILYFIRNFKWLPRILPEGNYEITAKISYKYFEEIKQSYSEVVVINLEAK
jgi:hypothetical protein